MWGTASVFSQTVMWLSVYVLPKTAAWVLSCRHPWSFCLKSYRIISTWIKYNMASEWSVEIQCVCELCTGRRFVLCYTLSEHYIYSLYSTEVRLPFMPALMMCDVPYVQSALVMHVISVWCHYYIYIFNTSFLHCSTFLWSSKSSYVFLRCDIPVVCRLQCRNKYVGPS